MPRVISVPCNRCSRKFGGHESYTRHFVPGSRQEKCRDESELRAKGFTQDRYGVWVRATAAPLSASVGPQTTQGALALAEDVRSPVPLARLSQAVQMLAEATTLEELTHLRSMAEAAEEYARAERLGDEAEQYAYQIRIRAARKAGELLKRMADSGERYKNTPGVDNRYQVEPEQPGPSRLGDFGITKDQSHRWQRLATVPEEVFEEAVVMRKGEVAIAREARKPRPERKLRPVKAENGKVKGPTEKQSLIGLRQAAVDLQSLAEGLDGQHYGDWSQLFDVAEAQEWFDILSESLPVVSARLKRILRDRKGTPDDD